MSRFAVFLRISFGSCVSLGWFYPWIWSAAQEAQKPLVLNPDPHVVSSLRTGGLDQQALKRGVGYHAGSYPVPGRIHFGIGLSLSDEGIRLRQSFGRSPLVYSRAIALGSSMYRKCLASKPHGLAVE